MARWMDGWLDRPTARWKVNWRLGQHAIDKWMDGWMKHNGFVFVSSALPHCLQKRQQPSVFLERERKWTLWKRWVTADFSQGVRLVPINLSYRECAHGSLTWSCLYSALLPKLEAIRECPWMIGICMTDYVGHCRSAIDDSMQCNSVVFCL